MKATVFHRLANLPHRIRNANSVAALRRIEVRAAGTKPDGYVPHGVMGASRRFERICTLRPRFAWKDRARLSVTLCGLCSLFILSNNPHRVARLLANPILFMMVKPSNGRWFEVLRATMEKAHRWRLLPLLAQLALIQWKSPFAAMLVRQGLARFRTPRNVVFEPARMADEYTLHALPFAIEIEAKRWLASRTNGGDRIRPSRHER